MNYSSYDRFQGAWLGSVIGSAIGRTDEVKASPALKAWGTVDHTHTGNYQKVIINQFDDWFEIREKIAQNIIQAQKVKTKHILEQLTPFTSKFNNTQNNNFLITSTSNLLSALLPLITFNENHESKYIYTELIEQCNSNSVATVEIAESILLWTYLLTLTLANRLELKEPNISMIVKQLLSGVEVKTASSIAKLNIVGKALKYGLSLQQLTEKICQTNNSNSDLDVMFTVTDAICLALYCFASTPHNFMLCVKRASHLPTYLSQSVTTLAATISGAYNGTAVIPRKWLNASDRHQGYQQTKKTCHQLYQSWLGTPQPNYPDLLYNPSLHAVAIPQIIQPRRNFQVISQNETFPTKLKPVHIAANQS